MSQFRSRGSDPSIKTKEHTSIKDNDYVLIDKLQTLIRLRLTLKEGMSQC